MPKAPTRRSQRLADKNQQFKEEPVRLYGPVYGPIYIGAANLYRKTPAELEENRCVDAWIRHGRDLTYPIWCKYWEVPAFRLRINNLPASH